MGFSDITQIIPSSGKLVSIIIPIYNGHKHLLELIQSLKNIQKVQLYVI